MADEEEAHQTQISAANMRIPGYGILGDLGIDNLSTMNANSAVLDGAHVARMTEMGNGNCALRNRNITGNSEFDSMAGKPNGLSTLSGVFAPVTISMFSALLFLRMSFVAGQLGFMLTVVELLLAYAIILLTVLSLCAVSSNGAVEGGGVYYMISRTLGPEFGGSIGVLFFAANIFSCALYIAGFTEALTNISGIGDLFGGKFVHCVMVSVVILLLCLLGAEIFAKTALLALSLIALAFGSFLFSVFVRPPADIPIPVDNTYAYLVPKNVSEPEGEKIVELNRTLTARYTSFRVSTFSDNFFPNYTRDYTTGRQTDFAFMFAIIFSGVTGLMAGANMSGELARPNVSIPRGTLQAVFTTLFTYVLTAFLLCLSCSRELLQNNYMAMVDISSVPSMIMLGIFVATFFSSMSNLIGASRVLTRFAQDKLFGALLKPATIEVGSKRNPMISVIISWIGVVLVLMIGAMNRIAKITSILFLLSYMGVNIATLALELTSAPNFRPNFKYFSWHSCALGAISTVVMMLIIDASMSAVAVVILMLLIMILHYQAPIGSWGSISQALIYHQVRKYLLLLDVRKEHVKFWRPQVLLLVNRPATSCSLMDFVNDLKKSGLYVVGHVQKGQMAADAATMDPLQQVFPYWLSLMDYLKLKAFVELTLADNVRNGIQQLIRLSGLGAMKPNTVVLGFHELESSEAALSEAHLLKDLKFSKIGRAEVVEYFNDCQNSERSLTTKRLNVSEYVQTLNDVVNLNKNLCVARHFEQFDREFVLRQAERRYIDVWPSHLFKQSDACKGSEDGVSTAPGMGLRWDNSSLFVLQLACILSMSSKWRSATLRVHICVNSLQDMHHQEQQLKGMLEQLRIKAKSVMVPWDHVVQHIDKTMATRVGRTSDITDYAEKFVRAVNETIQRNSSGAAVCFLNLPPPPPDGTKAEQYLAKLRLLTDSLPPTLLVHGLASVISTAL
ncbi:hypothetical protein GPALN_006270 [Globodera pallida]|nr:hypothetical protein GPALN_006270 [Globodera pallida]